MLKTFVPAVYKSRTIRSYIINPFFSAWAQRRYERAVAACQEPQKIIFLEEKESTMPQVMCPLWERMLAEINCEAEFVTLRQNNSTIPRYYVHCLNAIPLLAQASAIVANGNVALMDVLAVRSETKIIQLRSEADEYCAQNKAEILNQIFVTSYDEDAVYRVYEAVFGKDALAARARPKAQDVLIEAGVGGIDISIIIPAYNAQDGLQRALEHVEAQTYNHARMECIVVDDSSTDGTAQVAQEFAARNPGLFKVLQREECSGTPAAPRNDGLAATRGTYVFFHDADDYLEPDAVERMLDNAVNWGSDILLVKLFDDDNRGVARAMFTHSQPNADKYRSKVMWSFAPLKLFKRALIQDLRFPDFMPEDVSFVLRAYARARVVSVAADASYYHVTTTGSGHASMSTWENVDSNLRAYRDVFAFIDENVPDKDRDPVLMRRLFWRDIYRTFVAIAHEADTAPEVAQRHYEELIALVKPYWREGMYKTCPEEIRTVLSAALNDNWKRLQEVARSDNAPSN